MLKRYLLILLMLLGIQAGANAQSRFVEKVGGTFRKIFSKERKIEVSGPDYSRLPAVTYSEISGVTLENIFFELPTEIPALEEEVKFSDFSDLPEEYDIWSSTSINPYNVSLVGMKDTIKVDVSGYCPPSVKHVTSNWGFRKWKFHYGIDLKVHRGDTVRNAFDGTVRITRRDRGYGYFVVVRHDNGLETLYGHLNKILVKQDQKIKAGEAVGMGGNTGRSTGYHLHLEFRYLGNPINPNDIVDFQTHQVKKPVLVISSNTFAYKAEIDKIRYWTVKKGDTLGRIAYRTGVSVSKLCKLNGITTKTILRIGRKIRYT
ncbi:MAG: peptidoglycan DD-metalloendopeptidase family protein [Bacteroidales bacterium]|nr:peptidoglycan DD-metalloendopeptidase family protein [Bacteroidales bacterium]